MIEWEAEVLAAEPSGLGEGPWWDAERDRLLWVDIPVGRINVRDLASGSTEHIELGEPVGFVVGRRGGGYVAGAASGLVGLDESLHPTGWTAAPPDLDGGRRINDGVCDPAGRVLFGTVDAAGESEGALWSLGPEGSCVALVDGVAMSNGLAFSPDARLLYYIDSLTGRVDRFRYDVATGAVSDRRCVYRVPDADGLPDGVAVDRGGRVWVAIWGAGEVRCVTPDGCEVGRVRVPAARTTSCAFGGDRLYVTTALDGASNLDARGVDLAPGALFVADVGASGAEAWAAASARHGYETEGETT